MDKTEFLTGMVILEDAYDKFRIISDDRKMTTWYGLLKDIPVEHFKNNIKNHIAVSSFAPSISDLRAMQLITDDEAWNTLAEAIKSSARHVREE